MLLTVLLSATISCCAQANSKRTHTRRFAPVSASLNRNGQQTRSLSVDLDTVVWRVSTSLAAPSRHFHIIIASVFLQEPVAFVGGIFAGFLGLSLDQDPLREWIQQTAAGGQVSLQLDLACTDPLRM